VYIPSRDGVTLVLKHGPVFEVLARNQLSDGFDASPALVGSEIYMRGHKYLYCIAGG
jgi:outer membrane protein assembly factor BamB